ncbi:glutaredoxin family protein [Pseudoalteromonas mariniglutinosa]|uniref:glutaredoxin family protein n=1 Tax=Pseudoalteromonas mariniglutinosa TaxID=206042 RepID=UPI00384E4A91
MAKVTLYHTDGCHLCEKALALLTTVICQSHIEVVDIISDSQLLAEYQTSIPVLRNQQGERLFWPFDRQSLITFLTDKE